MEINLNTKQIVSIIHQLDIDDQISIFKEFSNEWLMFLGLSQLKPMTIDEYNEKLDRGLKDYKEGKTISHQAMKDEIRKWKTQKS